MDIGKHIKHHTIVPIRREVIAPEPEQRPVPVRQPDRPRKVEPVREKEPVE
jgi:hypothetical protein